MFVGNNLTDIRILHGLTRKQLATLLGITEQAVWQYENGYVSPKMEVINELKRIFSVKTKYFLQTNFLEQYKMSVVDYNHIAYRSSVINSVKKTQFEASHIEKIIAFLNFINENLEFPKNRIKELRNQVVTWLDQERSRRDCIIDIAHYARKFLGLNESGNQNLLFLLEKNGAFIFEKSIGDKIDAYSLWMTDDQPFIMLGNLKKSAVRRNFDLAHELGHLLLHYKVEFSMLDKRSLRDYEQEANMFAGELLVPRNEFKDEFLYISKVSHPDSYIEMKKKWMVSIQVLAFRAHYLELISYQQYRYFNMMLNRLEYKEVEPLDKKLPIPRPGKLRSILTLLFEEQHLSLDTMLDSLGVDIGFLRDLTGIDTEFFKQYQERQAKQFSIEDLTLKVN